MKIRQILIVSHIQESLILSKQRDQSLIDSSTVYSGKGHR